MADLLASHKSNYVALNRGENISGTITKLTSSEILVDLGAKTEAMVLEKDKNILHSLLSTLKVGDKVMVSILSPESEKGYPIVSLRRFIDDKTWDKLSDLASRKEIMEVTVDEGTKGGFLVSTDTGLSGFLPNSHLVAQDPSALIGKKIKAAVLEVNRASKKVIFSQKSTLTQKDFEESSTSIKPGEIISGKITSVAPFGIFVSLKSFTQTPLEGFIHQSEASWEQIEMSENFKPSDILEAKVLGLDRDNKRINLSIKRLTKDPFEEVMSQFVPEKKVSGIVTKVTASGVFVDLGSGIEGIIKKEKVPPNSSYEAGQEISATVSLIDPFRHKVTLVPVLLEKPMGYR